MGELDFALWYPFSAEAKAVLASTNVSVNDSAVALGAARIRKALSGELGRSMAVHKEQQLEEIVSYAAARFILGFMRNRFITNRFAVAEAKRASAYLAQEDDATLGRLEGQLRLSVTPAEGGYWVNLPAFVRCAPPSPPYKLSNRRLQQGRVFINRHERIRLLEEAVRIHTQAIRPVYDVSDSVKAAAEELKSLLPKLEPQQAVPLTGGYPPCIQQLLEDLKKHENLPHHARWYLGVYLMHRKMPLEQIVSLYSNLPDFDEKITRYQLEHIQKKGYSIPTCATIRSWGLLCPNCTRKSPLQWRGG